MGPIVLESRENTQAFGPFLCIFCPLMLSPMQAALKQQLYGKPPAPDESTE